MAKVRELIDGMLRQDIDAPRKQRQTATRIWHRLLDEHDADVGYPTVREYVRWRRPEILGTTEMSQAMVPQEHELAADEPDRDGVLRLPHRDQPGAIHTADVVAVEARLAAAGVENTDIPLVEVDALPKVVWPACRVHDR